MVNSDLIFVQELFPHPVRKAVDSFRCRLERVIQARGGHIEYNFVGWLTFSAPCIV